jgi:transposase
MPRGVILSDTEKGQISALRSTGLSEREIARRVGRSKTVVHQYLANPSNYGVKKRSGRPSTLTARDKRRIVNAASNSTASLRQIRDMQWLLNSQQFLGF